MFLFFANHAKFRQKYLYQNIIYKFNNKNKNEILKLIQIYKKPVLNSIIRLTIINTQNFKYAIELNVNTDSNQINCILEKIFSLKFNKINYIQIKTYIKILCQKKDINNHELFKKNKYLFSHDNYNFKLIYFYVFNNNLINNLIGSSQTKKQSFLQLRYNLSLLNLIQDNNNTLLKLLIENKITLENMIISNNIIISNEYNVSNKTYNDIQLETLILDKLQKLNITKKNIIDIYKTRNINKDTKKRTKILIKLLCIEN